MSKAPSDRFGSAQEVAVLLERALAHVQQPTGVPLPDELQQLTDKSPNRFSISKRAIAMMIFATGLTAIAMLLTQHATNLEQQTNGSRQNFSSGSDSYVRQALFDGAVVLGKNNERVLHVLHKGQWRDVHSIAGQPVQAIFEFADKNLDSERVNRRIAEDLLVLLQMMKIELHDSCPVEFRDGGGTREALIELAAHLMKSTDAPRIANVCKYRSYKGFRDRHLNSRFVYRKTSKRFDERERKAVSQFIESFKPEWEPDPAEFSDWHFLVLSKDEDDKRIVYDRPIVILMNQKCFSATDIFLGAFKGWPNVTLVGQPSSGGSAKTEDFDLPVSRMEIECASMASFQPNGKLYDSNGIQPDVLVEPSPEYFVRGGDDPFLDKAISILKAKPREK